MSDEMEDSDLVQLVKHIHTKNSLAQVSSKSSSKWVELPDCALFVDATGFFVDPTNV